MHYIFFIDVSLFVMLVSCDVNIFACALSYGGGGGCCDDEGRVTRI